MYLYRGFKAVCVRACVCVYMCVCACIFVCAYVGILTDRLPVAERMEHVITVVNAVGPANGKLNAGDSLISINGINVRHALVAIDLGPFSNSF